jgi:outer membrane protein assembly factor BamD (BamD/ComL family)
LKEKVAHAKKYLHRSHWSKKSWERYYSALKKRYPKSDWTIKDRVDHFYNLYKNNNGDSNKRTTPVQLSIPEWRSTLSKI